MGMWTSGMWYGDGKKSLSLLEVESRNFGNVDSTCSGSSALMDVALVYSVPI